MWSGYRITWLSHRRKIQIFSSHFVYHPHKNLEKKNYINTFFLINKPTNMQLIVLSILRYFVVF